MAFEGKPKSTAIVVGGRKKIHHEYQGGGEIVEEFDLVTDELVIRKKRCPTTLGAEGNWTFEVGEESHRPAEFDTIGMAVSAAAPSIVRRDSAEAFIWRIRNLSYPKSTYSIAIEDAYPKHITVRTSNKKYFKRIEIPEMSQFDLNLQADLLSWDHQGSTLQINYKKPQQVRKKEDEAKRERGRMKVERPPQDGECNPQ